MRSISWRVALAVSVFLLACFSANAQNTITVTSPNGGESWQAGSSHAFTWTATGIAGNVNLALLKAGAGYRSIATGVPASQGTFTWTVPSTTPVGSDYTVRVSTTDGTVADVSDLPFSVTAPPSITVTSPNGGESWTAGSTHNVTWSTTGLTGNVSLTLMKAGSGYRSIAASVPASPGSFSWVLPTNLPAASDYTVRVMSADGTVIDVSNATFTVVPGASITVTSPNGGETWRLGATQNVNWSTVGLTGTVNIALMKAGVGVRSIASGVPATQGSVSWVVPTNTTVGTDYTVRIMSADGTVVDLSNANFSILGTVTVTAPNGGESWPLGSTQNITWSPLGVTGNVSVTLMKAGSGYKSIAASVPASPGSLSWAVPTNLPIASDYTVRVMTSDGLALDVSNANFSVVAPPTITVLTPNGGDTWPLGSTQNITWSSTGLTGNVSLTLMKAGSGYRSIAASVPATPGNFSWVVPTTLPIASDYTVRVLSANGASVDVSNATFSVVPAGTLTVVSPNGGENWVRGTQQTVQWTSTGLTGNVSLTLMKAGSGYLSIASSVLASAGSFNWVLPSNLPLAADYTVRVLSADGTVVDVSNAPFTVVAPAPPLITTQPAPQTVTAGQAANFSVVASGTPPLSYQWMKNGVAISGATGPNYSTPPTTLADNGALFSVTVTGFGTVVSNSALLTVNSATFQVSGNIGLTNAGPNFQGLVGVTVAINTVPPQTTATDISGNFNFNGVPNGTYTVTPSLPGASAVFYPPTQTVNVNGGNTNTNFMAAVGYTLSGTVNYAGAKTGRIYLSLGGNGLPLGTSIAGPGPFTIRGVPPGNYVLFAWMDNVGQGVQNSSNPTGNVLNIPVSTTNVSGTVLNLTDATVPSIAAQAPGISNIAGADGAAIVFINPIRDFTFTETPTSYTVDWSTTSDFAVHNSKNFPATGGDQPYIVTGLTNGTPLFFRVQGQANDTSLWSTPSAAIPIGPTTGANQVSGTVTFGGTATGPMYVGFYDNGTGAIYSAKIATPVSPQAYTVNGVPNGTNYFNFVIIDQNNNGLIDAGDLSNTDHNNNVPVIVNGPTSGQNIVLSNANSTVFLTTDHSQGQSDFYNLSFNVNGNVKRVVAAALTGGPNVLTPMDAALNSGKGGGQLNFWQGINTTRPSVGDTYSVSVTYSDNTSETLHPTVTGVSDAFVSNLSPTGSIASTTPTFTWTDPVNAASYSYSFSLWDSNGSTIWQIPNNGGALTSAITSITWGVDPLGTGNLPSVGSLTPGANYSWGVWVADAQGNTASKQVGFSVSGTPVAPTINVQPQPQTVIVGQTATFSVSASGSPAPSYQWYKNGFPIAGAIFNSYTTPPTTLADSGAVFMVFVSNSVNSLFSNPAVLTVNPVATITVSGNINRANCGPNCPVAGINVSINTIPPQSANTDVSGNYSFSAVPNGNYSVTPSISGVSSAFFPPVQNVNVSGASVQANFMADIAYTVSGTVNYTGGKTGRIYITVSGGNTSVLLGTSISAPGAFSIRGVEPSAGFYSLHAWMDTQGRGVASAENPVGDALNVSVNSDTGGVVITLSDPAVPSLISQSPSIATLSATDGTAVVFVNSITNSAGVEIPTSYTVQWSDVSDFSANVNSRVFPAIGGRDPFIVTGLPNATLLYFRVQGQATTTSLWSNTWGPTLINPLSGSNVMSGSVTFPGTATGPMYVGFFNQSTNVMYMGRVPNPVSPQPYTVQGVPNGNYQFFAIIDQNNNGLIDAGDIENTEVNAAPVTINGPSSTMNLTLASANSLALMTTNHGQNVGQAFDNYSLNYRLVRGLKLPVALTSVSGNGAVVPMDLGFDGTKAGRVDFWQGVNGMRPTPGANYGLVVTYADGTSEPVNAQVTGVSDAFISTMSPQGVVPGNTTPTFTWTDPVNASNYLYNFNLWDTTGPNWQTLWTIPKKQQGFSSAFTSITWNVDPTGGGSHPSVSTLTSGHSYTWSVTTMDAQGNTASLNTGFNP